MASSGRKLHIIVTCTERKTAKVPERLHLRNVPGDEPGERASRWVERLAAEVTAPAFPPATSTLASTGQGLRPCRALPLTPRLNSGPAPLGTDSSRRRHSCGPTRRRSRQVTLTRSPAARLARRPGGTRSRAGRDQSRRSRARSGNSPSRIRTRPSSSCSRPPTCRPAGRTSRQRPSRPTRTGS